MSATHVPGAYEDFVRFVVPELQRRGLFRKVQVKPLSSEESTAGASTR